MEVYDIDITSYVHNSTIYKENEKIDDLVASLQDASAGLSKRFYDNQIKRKCRQTSLINVQRYIFRNPHVNLLNVVMTKCH